MPFPVSRTGEPIAVFIANESSLHSNAQRTLCKKTGSSPAIVIRVGGRVKVCTIDSDVSVSSVIVEPFTALDSITGPSTLLYGSGAILLHTGRP